MGKNAAGYRRLVAVTHRSDRPRLMVNTLAKAGTHLVMSLLDAFPDYRFSGRHVTFSVLDCEEPALSLALASASRQLSKLKSGFYATGHLAHHPEMVKALDDAEVKRIHVIRDPRALVVSTGLYMRSYKRHPLHATVNRRFPADEDLFRAVVLGFAQDDGDRHWPPMSARLGAFSPWLSDSGGLAIRFEDLVGAAGRGSTAKQRKTVAQIAGFLGLDTHDEAIASAADAAFDPRAATFRSGAVDGWKSHLSSDTVDLISSECGALIDDLGYRLD